jgi:hypothetical protein
VALVVLLVLTAAAAIVFRAKLFKSGTPSTPTRPPRRSWSPRPWTVPGGTIWRG